MDQDESQKPPNCPLCNKAGNDASCLHFLVSVDRTYGEMTGDEWWDVAAPSFEALDEAARRLAARLPTLSEREQSAVHSHLATRQLAESFQFLTTEMRNGDELASIRGNTDRGWHSFLHRLLQAVSKPVVSRFEAGHLGMRSVETWYWATDANQAAADFAQLVQKEADALDALGIEQKATPPKETKPAQKVSPSKPRPRRK